MVETIKVKYLDPENTNYMQMTENGDWCDCYAFSDLSLKAGEFGYVNLGFACQLPDGYEAHLAPRSSTFKNFGVLQTNGVGIIDNSFCGDSDVWMMPVYATRDTEIHKGDRPCQFRIVKKQPDIEFVEVTSLGNEDRGGFGSTGV